MQSASGGVFGAIARRFIESGGVVFGCANISSDANLKVGHVAVSSVKDLKLLLGSKYVQSDLNGIFQKVQVCLREGPVLFSGTPCQVSSLMAYLGGRPRNLFTIDLICHGTPNQRMLNEYLGVRPHSRIARPISVQFRNKSKGWPSSLMMEVVYSDGFNELIPSDESSYFDLFLKLYTLRDSCYSCPFAGSSHPADLTIGDFWGIEQEFPEVNKTERGKEIVNNGISCVLVNTGEGEGLIREFGGDLALYPVGYSSIARHNEQLNAPSHEPEDRLRLLNLFRDGGWAAVEGDWLKQNRFRLMKKRVNALVPKSVKQVLKSLVKR